MGQIIGLFLIVFGIGFGIWAGIWWAFVGGIIQIINAFSPLDAVSIAWGVVKIVFAGVIGWCAAIACIIPGLGFLNMKPKRKSMFK
jgi:hypothetical protein